MGRMLESAVLRAGFISLREKPPPLRDLMSRFRCFQQWV